MDVTRKEEYEIDPNSSFNRLRTLQKNLKEENALRDNYSKSKDELLKKIDSHCYRYYKTKIAIHELYDMPIKSEINNMKYVVAENGQAELPQCYEPLYNLMFIFRNDNALMLKLIEKSSINQYGILATFMCHFFYENLFSSNQDSEDLLLMIYLLLEKEVDCLKDVSSSESFLNQSKSFVSRIFNNLSRKNEVRNYLEIILHKLIIDFENINNKTNENNSHINLDLHKIKEELNTDKKKEKKVRKLSDYKHFLTSKVKVSNIFTSLNQILRESKNKDSIPTYYEENKQIIDFYIFSKQDEDNLFTYDSIEQYFEEHGLYEKEKRNSIVESEMMYNTSYSDDLTRESINNVLKYEKNVDMIQFYKKQLETLQHSKDDKLFTTNDLISEINNDKDLKENAERIILVYKYTFEKVKEYIDYIFCSILQNKSTIPYIIKCICVIIYQLISIKFPNSSNVYRNSFICNFFFDNIILHELTQPSYNGLVPELTVSDAKRRKIETVTKVLKQITKGSFFCSNVEKDKVYTMFNAYFGLILPYLFEVCKELQKVKLPKIIEDLLNNKRKGISSNSNNYNYLKEHPDEFIHLQSMCFSIDDFYMVYGIIKSNDQFFCSDKTSFFAKTFKKLSFHEKTIQKKISADNEKGKKTYVYLTKTNYSDKVKDSVFAQKSQKFSFQSGNEDMKENANEIFIFERVKYSINTIVKHLNTLTRANFSADSESMENFVKGLNTMIELEGFSEILKEKTIPLDWFGLYLQSNIGGIPQSKSRANYYQLYSDLIEDSQANFNIIKNDDTLNCVNSKTKISEKNIEIQNNTLINYKQMIIRFQVAKFFFMNEGYNICLKVIHKDGMPNKILIVPSEEVCKLKTGFLERKKTKHVDVNNINQLFEEFPDLIKDTTETDILNYQSNNNFPASFHSFFDALKGIITKKIAITFDTPEDFDNMFIEVQNIIFRKLHPKLYPDMASENDLLFFRNCFNFSWIKPGNLHKELHVVNDDILTLASDYIRNLNNEISPFDKLKAFAKAYEIVQSTLKLFDIKDETALDKMLMYVFIKAQLIGVDSNYLYMELYLTKEQRTPYYQKILRLFAQTKLSIEKLTKESLVNITDEEYNMNVQKVYFGQQ